MIYFKFLKMHSNLIMYKESGWEIGSCGNDVHTKTEDENKVNLEGNGERYKF